MPSQAAIQQTILNGQYSFATLVNNNYKLIQSGGLAIREGFVNFFGLSLQALIDQYSITDYTSSTTITLYDRINNFVGIPYGATVDPNFQNPSIVIDVEEPPFAPLILVKSQANLVDAGGGNYYLPFTDNSNAPIYNGQVPVSVTVNGVSFTFTFDETFTPSRIYGFSNNDTQTIVVTVI